MRATLVYWRYVDGNDLRMRLGMWLQGNRVGWRVRSALLLLTMAVLSVGVRAQDADDDDFEDGPSLSATLSLVYSAKGDATVHFYSYAEIDPQHWMPIQTALETAVQCPAGALSHPRPAPLSAHMKTLSAKRQAEMEQWYERESQGTLRGECKGAMTRNGLLLSQEMQFAPLLAAMRQAAISLEPTGQEATGKEATGQEAAGATLNVYISHPATKYEDHTPSNAPQYESSAMPWHGRPSLEYLKYRFDAADAAAKTVHLAFGMRRQDVVRAMALPAGFLLLPIGIVLWVRRAALRNAGDDATAAWFSYVRVMTWCGNALFIVWTFGPFRDGLTEIVSDRLGSSGAAAIAIGTGLMLLPPWIPYVICLLSSYGVYVRIKGERWTRGEFYRNQFLEAGSMMVPLMFFVAGLSMLGSDSRVGIALQFAAYLTYKIGGSLKLKYSGNQFEAVTTGELRDRVFALAKQAAVEIKQVYLMRTGKSMMANAFASSSGMVIFTDYLLARLDKREVSAVAAHEITHIKNKHGKWKMLGWPLLMFSPELVPWVLRLIDRPIATILRLQQANGGAAADSGYHSVLVAVHQAIDWAAATPEMALVYYVIGFVLFSMQSQYMERVADAGAVQLTQDPEAKITALLKIGRLNLMPLEWGRATGSILTHPSTMKRIERIARLGQVPPERLQELLREHQNLQQQQHQKIAEAQFTLNAVEVESVPAGETFAEAQPRPERVVAKERFLSSRTVKLWYVRAVCILPATAVAWSVGHWHPSSKPAAYILGAIGCVVFWEIATLWMDTWGRAALEREFRAKLEASEIVFPEGSAWTVELNPHGAPRFYANGVHWDLGYLYLTRGCLCYIGNETRFALRPQDVRGVRLGQGEPDWFAIPRVYIDWWDERCGQLRSWSVYPKKPCGLWEFRRLSGELLAAVELWRTQPASFPETPVTMQEVAAPSVGEVTSRSFRSLFNMGATLKILSTWMLLAAVICTVLKVPGLWYVWSVIAVVKVYNNLPYWLYKEPREASPSQVPAGVAERA